MEIERIDNKYIVNQSALIINFHNELSLLMNSNEVNYLQMKKTIYKNSFINDMRKFFMDSEIIPKQKDFPSFFYNCFLDMNKIYINVVNKNNELKIYKEFCINKDNKFYICVDPIDIDINDNQEDIFDKEQLSKIFNIKNYNSLFIFDIKGNMLYGSDNNFIVKNNVLSKTNEENIDKLPYVFIGAKDNEINIYRFNLEFLEDKTIKIIHSKLAQLSNINSNDIEFEDNEEEYLIVPKSKVMKI